MSVDAAPKWVERYLGIPFVEEGSDFPGCHCWGLARLVFAHERGIDLPRHAGIAASHARSVARLMRAGAAAAEWAKVGGPWGQFDVVLMASYEARADRALRYPGHVGLAVGPRLVLHVERSIGEARCVPVDDFSIRSRILSVHRYRP